jgi:hypothetical protein
LYVDTMGKSSATGQKPRLFRIRLSDDDDVGPSQVFELPPSARLRHKKESFSHATLESPEPPVVRPVPAAKRVKAAAAAQEISNLPMPTDTDSVCDQWAARASSRLVSLTEAAELSGLGRCILVGWCEQKLVQHLKVGVNNAKRLVSLGDVLRLRDQKLVPSMPRPLIPGCRSLIYTRVDKSNDNKSEEEADAELHSLATDLEAELVQRHPSLAAWKPRHFAEIGAQANLNRPGFVQLIAVILAREIDNLIVTDAEQLCPAGCVPLLEFLCAQNHITLVQVRPQDEFMHDE